MKRKVAALLISSLLMAPVQSFADSGVETSTYEVQINKENSNTEEVSKGITPDSFLYILDKLAENIKITITFDSVKKAKLFLAIAQERLGESNSMIIRSKNDLAEKALKEYQITLDNAINTTNEALENGEKVSDITKEIEDATLSHKEIIEKILVKLNNEIKDTVKEELENIYTKAEVTKDVVSLVEEVDEKNGEIQEKEIEEKGSLENVAVEVIIKEEIKDESVIEKAQTEKLNSRQMIAIISLAQQSGKSIEEVIDIFKDNNKGLGSTALALGIAPKNTLKGINETFRKYKCQAKALIKSNGGNITLEQLEEFNEKIAKEVRSNSTENNSTKNNSIEDSNNIGNDSTAADIQKPSSQESTNQNSTNKGTLIIINEEQQGTNDDDKYSKIININVKAKETVKESKEKCTNDKTVKEAKKAEKKANKAIQKAEKKAKKFETKNKSKESKKKYKSSGNNNSWGNVKENK